MTPALVCERSGGEESVDVAESSVMETEMWDAESTVVGEEVEEEEEEDASQMEEEERVPEGVLSESVGASERPEPKEQ